MMLPSLPGIQGKPLSDGPIEQLYDQFFLIWIIDTNIIVLDMNKICPMPTLMVFNGCYVMNFYHLPVWVYSIL